METTEGQTKQEADLKIGKVFLVFAGICIIVLPFVVLSAFLSEAPDMKTTLIAAQSRNFDEHGQAIFENYDRIVKDYLEGLSTERTLEEYYSRRQYIGSPPLIPHVVEDAEGAEMACATCHVKGGWTEELRRHTPVTPHPQHTACRQCHVPKDDAQVLFVDSEWMSVRPPVLGRSHLPGGPPPIPHQLQMRGECIACHVGPGAVTAIRVQHPMRGNCRQCHVPDAFAGLFERESEY